MLKIVFCTTCKGRVQHLQQTLPRNLADNLEADVKFVVLDYCDPGFVKTYFRVYHQNVLRVGKVVVYEYRGEPAGDGFNAVPFRMAHAKNMAHRCGMLEGADVLVNLDADNYTGPAFGKYLANQFEGDAGSFMWAKMIYGVLPRGIHGRIAVTPQALLSSGGYDEKYSAWGPDDKDFNNRLRNLGYTARKIDNRFLARGVPHNDKIRFREYPQAQANAEEHHAIEEAATIANWGRFGMGIVRRNYDGPPIELGPVPTRVFGIGMHKTATTSLYSALNILGINSAHWKNAHWAKAVYREMTEGGRSRTLEQNYALCDLPITILFRELDRGYPGSKFILTMKSEEKWIRDVRDHWGYDTNIYRRGWDTDPFTNRLHQLVYGQRHFDEAVFLNRYRAHNAEVLEYFKARAGDLLVMNMDGGAGWPELCGFLGRPVPSAPYPCIDPTRPEPIEAIIGFL